MTAHVPRRRGRHAAYGHRRALALGGLLLAVVMVAVGVLVWQRVRAAMGPLAGEERCVATVGGRSVVVDLDQAHYTSIVVGLSVRRGLAARAGSVAMATVYQETGIRNLDYGDRDSVGLFQQRPSQGWGTEKQLMDPYYATGKFYDALVKVRGWQTRDVTEVAQAVQRSAYPDAYAEHEPDARVLSSALTGQTPRSLSCLVSDGGAGDADGLADSLTRTFKQKVGVVGKVVTVRAASDRLAWAYAQHAVANAGRHGVLSVAVDDQVWTTDEYSLPSWTKGTDVGRTVQITVR